MSIDFIEALAEIEHEKGIAKEILIDAIEAALISSYKRNFNAAQNVRVDINRTTGVIKVYARKTVVDEVMDPRHEISLHASREVNPNYQIDDVCEIEVTPREFGRIAAQTAKQVVTQRIREAERGLIYHAFVDRAEDIVTGIVQRQDTRNVFIDLGKVEAVLPLNEMMPNEKFKHGDRVKAYITKVENTTKGPQIILSRTHPGLLKRLFELEVPEIFEGVVEIKSVAREAGQRSKIAVYSRNPEVDPVGSCVGPKGTRVQTIVNELRGEKIDIVRWSEDVEEYVANSLSPSKVVEVDVREVEKMARVIVPDYQLSLAIGIKGQNARLAAKLTGWKIDIKSESQIGEVIAAELEAEDLANEQERLAAEQGFEPTESFEQEEALNESDEEITETQQTQE
ncbi:transcription termination factor NusA [Paenibacillus assamensis]|uniref:transcription termination factor NusA n=1 Tax=Paenibacillus assamensis TaxID=311244 RepID=UPI00041E230F|nr:transcription termination factor NusA [Paenibacillus assamensis]